MIILSKNAETVLAKRYYRKNDKGEIIENAEQLFRRVAHNIAQAEKNYETKNIQEIEDQFFNIMANLEFLPNSPTLANAGGSLQQLAACFVLPIADSMEGIFDAVKATALIQKSGGGTGMSFSRLRPSGDTVDKTQGVSSGPISFMKVFNATTETIKQGGMRRGANMGCLRVDHPNVMDFINCKKDPKEFTNFNISIAATDKFMKALERHKEYEIINPRTKEPIRKVKAKDVLDVIIDNAWLNGEPGLIFIDKINKDNPTPQLGEIESTNPCGEQPLLPWEACNLGSINLSKMVVPNDGVDWDKLKKTIHIAVRFLDNVIDMGKYPLPEIEKMVKGNRKIGLGVMGWADMLVSMKIPYNSKDALRMADKVMKFINEESKEASTALAKIRGTFPNFKGSIYDTKSGWKLRNATTTTIAPTGTLSIVAGCSSGIEPLFAVAYIRTVLDGTKLTEVHPVFEGMLKKENIYSEALIQKVLQSDSIQNIEEINVEHIKEIFVTAHDVAPEWHVKMQASFQRHVDNAVSKTVNLPNSATREEVKEIFMLAYEEGCKGITVYRDGSRDEQVLSTVKSKKENKVKERPSVLSGKTHKLPTAQCGNMYLTVNVDEKCKLAEIFPTLGQCGDCIKAHQEAIGKIASNALNSGTPPEVIIKSLKGINCPKPRMSKDGMERSCLDAMAKTLEAYITTKVEVVKPGDSARCPECSTPLPDAHCLTCPTCGYSSCS